MVLKVSLSNEELSLSPYGIPSNQGKSNGGMIVDWAPTTAPRAPK